MGNDRMVGKDQTTSDKRQEHQLVWQQKLYQFLDKTYKLLHFTTCLVHGCSD